MTGKGVRNRIFQEENFKSINLGTCLLPA